MERVPLRSKTGCIRCRQRRRKCNENKPVCGECFRLGFKCVWRTADHTNDKSQSSRSPSAEWTATISSRTVTDTHENQLVVSPNSSHRSDSSSPGDSFDHPALLPSSVTSVVTSVGDKHVLQYLCEQGHSILRYPTQRFPTHQSINSFRAGFGMASQSPIQVEAYLCLGASYLAKRYPQYEKTALKHYNQAIFALRSELQLCEEKPPAEWTCAVAAILSRYESRFAHLLGFHRLIEARIQWRQPWGATRMLLEHYVHSLSDNSLFHRDELIGKRPIDYLDGMMAVLNEKPRPLGRELVGVPEDLTLLVYRLAFLNCVDVTQSPWDFELTAVTASLETWEPRGYALNPAGAALLLISKLYHLACICLVRNIRNRRAGGDDAKIASCLRDAGLLVQSSNLREQPFNSAAWPLTIFGIFATDPLQSLVFKQPIENLVDKAGLKGYSSVLALFSHITRQGMGPEVLQRQDLLSIVHI